MCSLNDKHIFLSYLNAKAISMMVRAFRITNANTNTVFEGIVLGFIKI